MEPFWFIEALFQLYLIMFLLFLMPWVRRVAADDPWRFAVGLMALAWVLKLAAMRLWGSEAQVNMNRAPDSTFLLFGIGWALWFARDGRQRLLMTAVAAVLVLCTIGLVPGAALWDGLPERVGYVHGLWLGLGLLLMMYLPRMPLPSVLHGPIGAISGAGYYIYLTHGVLVYLALQVLPGTPLVLTVTASLLTGIAVGWGMNALARVAGGRARRR